MSAFVRWTQAPRTNKPQLVLESKYGRESFTLPISKAEALHLAYELIQAAVILDNSKKGK